MFIIKIITCIIKVNNVKVTEDDEMKYILSGVIMQNYFNKLETGFEYSYINNKVHFKRCEINV